MKTEETIGKLLIDKNLTLSVAESCTGGLISSILTDVSGSSAYIKLNFVTYSNESKIETLKVLEETIDVYGAVSEQVALAMSIGARKAAKTDIGVGVTGIAGPTGATENKSVGLVYIAISSNKTAQMHKINANPELERHEIKEFAAKSALEAILEFLNKFY